MSVPPLEIPLRMAYPTPAPMMVPPKMALIIGSGVSVVSGTKWIKMELMVTVNRVNRVNCFPKRNQAKIIKGTLIRKSVADIGR